jgi:hypothetical protein
MDVIADPNFLHWNECLHGSGAPGRGMYLYGYVCVEHPRLTVHVVRDSLRVPERRVWFVDGREHPDFSSAVVALGEPHDLDGIAKRLEDRMFNKTVVFVNGYLIVVGETASRIVRLKKSLPSFEGVPIEYAEPSPWHAMLREDDESS